MDEWLNTVPSVGPDTQLLIVNADTDKACTSGRTRHGFVHPMKLDEATVAFRQVVCTPEGHESHEFRVNLPDGRDWIPLEFANPRVLSMILPKIRTR